MDKEQFELLKRELCGRLPHGVQCHYEAAVPMLGSVTNVGTLTDIRDGGKRFVVGGHVCLIGDIKPYLRPMSSMTKEEREEYHAFFPLLPRDLMTPNDAIKMLDFLNSHHFDYRGLIERGLALEAPEDMYN